MTAITNHDEAAKSLQISVEDLDVPEMVAKIMDHCATLQVSDVFFSSEETHVCVRVRHWGLLRLVTMLPLDDGRRCIAHIKAMSGMEISERRRPLDGRWIYERDNLTVDLRVNSIPTLYGEDVTMRLLPRDSGLLKLDSIGLVRGDYNQMVGLLSKPGGLVLVTGPTGSGKTTTLYACLAHLNNGERKINTIEDPVEYAMVNVRQSQVNPRIDLGFPDLLASVLRQSPDVIMIGEIRDPATADTAVRAANSGHLVLGTLHAPTAAGAVQSMLSLGVHPHFLSSSIQGVIGQRLVRMLCQKCKQAFELDEALPTFDEVRRWLEPGEGKVLYGPGGCAECRMQGYSGRTGVFEVMVMTRGLRQMILTKQPTEVLRQKAIDEGMVEFRQAALLKVARGETSIEEVFRTVPSEYLSVVI
jgi:type II secretory ATPase GspE/PulE/Tfp pilus assembly ATPase PilB-like protein